MSAILDVLVIAIVLITVFVCGKRGFFKSLIKVGSVILAIVAVVLFFGKLKTYMLESKTCETVREKMNDRLAEIVSSEEDEYDPNEVKESPKFIEILQILGVETSEFEKTWQQWRTERTDELREKLVNFVSDPLIDMIASVLSFIALFFGTLIAVRLLGFVLDKIFVLPVLKQANTALGVLLGLIMAVIYVSAFVYVVNHALPYLQAKGSEFFMRIDPEKTYVFKWFAEHDLIAWLLGR
jgi:uncharacterized membrane protein required for colicin V production